MTTQAFATRMAANRLRYVEHSANPGALFPLTPGEREQQMRSPDISPPAGLANALATVLPLPKGEGWGEGEDNARKTLAPNAPQLPFLP